MPRVQFCSLSIVRTTRSPSKTWPLPTECSTSDGRVVTITDGKIATIEEKEAEQVEPVNAEEIEELRNQVQTLTDSLTEAQALIAEQKEVIVSNYTPAPRVAAVKVAKNTKANTNTKTSAELTAEVKEKRANSKTL